MCVILGILSRIASARDRLGATGGQDSGRARRPACSRAPPPTREPVRADSAAAKQKGARAPTFLYKIMTREAAAPPAGRWAARRSSRSLRISSAPSPPPRRRSPPGSDRRRRAAQSAARRRHHPGRQPSLADRAGRRRDWPPDEILCARCEPCAHAHARSGEPCRRSLSCGLDSRDPHTRKDLPPVTLGRPACGGERPRPS